MSSITRPGYRYAAVKEEAALPDDPGSGNFAQQADQLSDSTHASATWCPPYLRLRTLVAFFAIFMVFIIASEVLLAISNHNRGLATSHPSLHYLWTFGPTAILTLVASLWARVEFQAKLTAPWYRMMKGPAKADRTLLLDYLSMMQPVSLIKAIRNTDYAVATIVGVSIMIRITIVSTGLITLSIVEVSHSSVPVTLQSSFHNNLNTTFNDVSGATELPYYVVARGLLQLNLTLPDGVTRQFAYQSIGSDLPLTTEFQATVDGFSAGLECEPATLNPGLAFFNHAAVSMDANITSPSCKMAATFWAPSYNETANYFSRFIAGNCGNSTNLNDKRVAVVYGFVKWEQGPEYDGNSLLHYSAPVILQSAQLICIPTYNISALNVSKNGTQTLSALISSNANARQLVGVHAWDIMQTHLSSYSNAIERQRGTYSLTFESVSVDVDIYMNVALQLHNRTGNGLLPTAPLDEHFLFDLAMSYWQQFAAAVAHSSLMESSLMPSSATAVTLENRLVVRPMAAHLMAALLAISLLLILVSYHALPKNRSLPCNPTTLVGTASLLALSRPLIQSLSRLGSVDIGVLSDVIKCSDYQVRSPVHPNGQFTIHATNRIPANNDLESLDMRSRYNHPVSLHPWTRLTILLVLAGCIAGLEAALRVSENNAGLDDIEDETYMHYLWTTGPAVLFSLIALYLGAVDFQNRCLTPYTNLRLGRSYSSSIGLNLIDRTIPPTIRKEMQTGNWAALSNTLTIGIASFLTIISASLFHPMPLPTISSTQLQTVTSFSLNVSVFWNGDAYYHAGSNAAASLILESNLTYPAFTYEKLAFPEFQLASSSLNDHHRQDRNGSNSALMINSTVPALRSRFSCRLYDSTQIRTNVKYRGSGQDYYEIFLYIAEESCNVGDHNESTSTIQRNATEAFFGRTAQRDVYGCSDFLWAWGHGSMLSSPNVTSVSAMGCNETLEVVDVAMTFFGPELRIDPAYPPLPNESTVRKSPLGTEVLGSTFDGGIYQALVDVANGGLGWIPFSACSRHPAMRFPRICSEMRPKHRRSPTQSHFSTASFARRCSAGNSAFRQTTRMLH